MAAEVVLCNASIERVGHDVALATQQAKRLFTDDQVQEPCHAANAAIASRGFYVRGCIDFECYFPAMTTARVCRHHSVTRLCQTGIMLLEGIA